MYFVNKEYLASLSQEILECGKQHGLTPKVHAEEMTALGGASMAAEVEAISPITLLCTDEGIEDMSHSELLPSYFPVRPSS